MHIETIVGQCDSGPKLDSLAETKRVVEAASSLGPIRRHALRGVPCAFLIGLRQTSLSKYVLTSILAATMPRVCWRPT